MHGAYAWILWNRGARRYATVWILSATLFPLWLKSHTLSCFTGSFWHWHTSEKQKSNGGVLCQFARHTHWHVVMSILFLYHMHCETKEAFQGTAWHRLCLAFHRIQHAAIFPWIFVHRFLCDFCWFRNSLLGCCTYESYPCMYQLSMRQSS